MAFTSQMGKHVTGAPLRLFRGAFVETSLTCRKPSLVSNITPCRPTGLLSQNLATIGFLHHELASSSHTFLRSFSIITSRFRQPQGDQHQHQHSPSKPTPIKEAHFIPQPTTNSASVDAEQAPADPSDQDPDQINFAQHIRRCKIALWSVMGVFGAVFLLEASSPIRETKGQRPLFVIETEAKTSINGPGFEALKSAFRVENISYRVDQWPPRGLHLRSYAPYTTSMFAHGGLLHLAVNSWGFYQLGGFLMMQTPLGISGTLATFVIGGTMAAHLNCYVNQLYADGKHADVFKLLKRYPTDPNPQQTLQVLHLGASSGLMALFAVTVLGRPFSKWAFPIANIPAPAVVFAALSLAWDVYGYHENQPDGIGHDGHLCGWLSGAVIWFALWRRGKSGQAFKQASIYDRIS